MKAVGIRELKNRLSEFLRDVRAGEAVLVTDRGEVVAEIHPPGHAPADTGMPPGLQALARRGLLRVGGANRADLYPDLSRALDRGTSGDLLDEERGAR